MAKISSQQVFNRSSRTPEQRAATAAASGGGIPVREYKEITTSIFHINKNLLGIKSIIAEDIAADQKAAADQKLDKQRQSDNLRKNIKEGALEKSLINTFKKPVLKLKKMAGNIFNELWTSLQSLFGAWLLDKIGKMIQAWQEDPESFEKLKVEVIKGVGTATALLLGIHVGVPLLMGAIGGLVGSMMGGVPGLLAVLANPIVWAGVGAVLAKHVQMQSKAEKNITDTISEKGTDKTLEILRKELQMKINARNNLINSPVVGMPGGWIALVQLGTEISELKKQIYLMEEGYAGSGDDRYRQKGHKINVASIPFFNDRGINDTQVFKELKKQTSPLTGGIEEQDLITELIRSYRHLSGLQATVSQLSQKIAADPGNDALKDERSKAKEQIVNITDKITQILGPNGGLQPNAIKSITRLQQIVEPTGGEMTAANYEEMATYTRVLFPRASFDKEQKQRNKLELNTTVIEDDSSTIENGKGGRSDELNPSSMHTNHGALNSSVGSNTGSSRSGTAQFIANSTPVKPRTKVDIVPIDLSSASPNHGGAAGTNAEETPTISTSDSNNEMLLHFQNQYEGVG
tara:strand:- start:1138 stop:2865 length:1728 start_codon:yes stop_codon:yes gene_type:complete